MLYKTVLFWKSKAILDIHVDSVYLEESLKKKKIKHEELGPM